MIRSTKSICNSSRPLMKRSTSYECDWCNRRCDPNGSRSDRIYEYDGEQLCLDCLLENLENAGIIRQITE